MSSDAEKREFRRLVATLANDKNIRIDKFYQPRDMFLPDLGPAHSLCVVSQGNRTLCEFDDNDVNIGGKPVLSSGIGMNVRNFVNNIYNSRKYAK